MADPIEVGADVYFVRAARDMNLHSAKVVGHIRDDGAGVDGLMYKISCPTFPYEPAAALAHEVFLDRELAVRALDEAVMSSKQNQLERLLIERDRIDVEIEQLRAQLSAGERKKGFSLGL